MIITPDLNNPKITGRLGNQLFVVAAALALAARHHDHAVFPT
jgi:hypothetical protein